MAQIEELGRWLGAANGAARPCTAFAELRVRSFRPLDCMSGGRIEVFGCVLVVNGLARELREPDFDALRLEHSIGNGNCLRARKAGCSSGYSGLGIKPEKDR